MKKLVLALVVITLALPLTAAQTWKSVALLDAGCAGKAEMLAHPEDHPKSCALRCGKSGYGAVIDGKFVKFDQKGSDLAAAAIKKTEKTDHLTATITGEMKDGVIEVSTLTLD